MIKGENSVPKRRTMNTIIPPINALIIPGISSGCKKVIIVTATTATAKPNILSFIFLANALTLFFFNLSPYILLL